MIPQDTVKSKMEQVKEWSETPECEKPYAFLKSAAHEYNFGDWGLNQVAHIHFPHIAKVMHDYAQSLRPKQDEQEQLWEEIEKLIPVKSIVAELKAKYSIKRK